MVWAVGCLGVKGERAYYTSTRDCLLQQGWEQMINLDVCAECATPHHAAEQLCDELWCVLACRQMMNGVGLLALLLLMYLAGQVAHL